MVLWYYLQDSQPVGPLDEPQILALIGQGKIRAEDLVWREGMPQWISAAAAGLIKAAPAQRPPALPIHPAASPDGKSRDYRRMIDECRALLGAAPRDLEISPYIQLAPPPWLEKKPQDLLWEIYRQQNVLWRNGSIVWGRILMANDSLYLPKEGGTDNPAAVIYSLHPSFDSQLDQLEKIVGSVGSALRKQHTDPEMMELSRQFSDDRDRKPRLLLPKAISGEHPIFLTTMMIVRKHLPKGYLTKQFFPMLVEPQTTSAAIIVPSRYWPSSLLAEWEPVAKPKKKIVQ